MKGMLEMFKKFNKFRNSRILVVDDEEFCISMMEGILAGVGIDVEYQVVWKISKILLIIKYYFEKYEVY